MFATFLKWVVEEDSGLTTLEHYLDCFIFAGKNQTKNYWKLMKTFQHICDELTEREDTSSSELSCISGVRG